MGDADTIKLSGAADVPRVLDDLDKISDRARSLDVPGASGRVPQKLTPQQRKAAADAIKALDVTVYTGAADRMLRRLVVEADLQDSASSAGAKILLDVTFTKVGEEQRFTSSRGTRSRSPICSPPSARPAWASLSARRRRGDARLHFAEQRRQVRRLHRAGERRQVEVAQVRGAALRLTSRSVRDERFSRLSPPAAPILRSR